MTTVKVQFEGGLQIDFNSPSGLSLSVPVGTTLRQLPAIVASQFDPAKSVRFVNLQGETIPGILVMLNDVDSEVEGLDAVLKRDDIITFISTLHGG